MEINLDAVLHSLKISQFIKCSGAQVELHAWRLMRYQPSWYLNETPFSNGECDVYSKVWEIYLFIYFPKSSRTSLVSEHESGSALGSCQVSLSFKLAEWDRMC